MPDTWLPIAGVLGLVLLAVVYMLGSSDGAQDERERQLLEHQEKLLDELESEEKRARAAAFARAAEAVTLWPHRINRRADLARHIDALGSASDCAPVPEPSAAVAAVPASEDVLEPAQDEERVVDVYRHEGFL